MPDSNHDEHGTSVAVYTRSVLEIVYDYLVLGFNMSYVWRSPTKSVLLPFFTENLSARHLDCGVGTGYFPANALKKIAKERPQERFVLLDANTNALEVAKARTLAGAPKVEVECFEGDVKKPLPKELQGAEFDSITMFSLFHCVPGADKLQGLKYYAEVLSDDGVLAGCSVLGRKYSPGWLSTFILNLYNKHGIMHNADDNQEQFDVALREVFEEVETRVVGMMILFKAKKPKRN